MFVIGSNGASGYNLTRSLRFRASASASLSRTMTTPTNNKIWTICAMVKLGAISALSRLMTTNVTVSNLAPATFMYFDSNAQFNFYEWQGGVNNYVMTGAPVFRDPSAWYQIVIAIDTTQATNSNRVKVYFNNTQLTLTASGSGWIPQNTNTGMNSALPQYIGRAYDGGYFDGCMAEFNFIDGQALTPSSFGSTNALTGVWQPAAYTGSYGTNGFYLPFTDNSALTTASNVGLGKDFSGNANYWVTNNISITAGVTYDSMTDVPTLTSATAANFAVLNPLLSSNTITFSQANLSAVVGASGSVYRTAGGTIAVNSGKWYFEDVYGGGGNCNAGVGEIAQSKSTWESDTTINTAFWFVQGSNGNKINGDGSGTSYGSAFSTNDIIMVAVDVTNGKIWWGKNGTWFASGDPATAANPAFTNLTGKNITPAFFGGSGASGSGTHTPNFGQRPFTYTAPTGYVALNTYNLPTSTIVKGNTVMDATLYTGTGATQSITNAAAFKPDLVWIKNRSAADDNQLVDSVRGVTLRLISNGTNAESANAAGLTAFNSNGFTIGSDANYNRSGSSLVGWQWQAGQGTTSSNTSGSITSTVSVNASAGFSVVTYTGTGANATVGHGLGVAPQLIIVKARSFVQNWTVYHQSLGNTNAMFLDLTNASTANILYWNNTSPTSSVFSIGSGNGVNSSGNTYVAYCWTPIAGFSAFGSYTGNGSTDGPFVYTGFRPKFVMFKASSAAGDWIMVDTSRDPENVMDARLQANAADAESTTTFIDAVSNGFKVRTTNANINASSVTVTYMAYAENPFKNSLAR